MMNVKLNSTCHSDRSGGIFVKSYPIVKRFLHSALKAFRAPVEMTLVLMCLSLNTLASPQEEYPKANAFYNEGNYVEAITIYEEILNNNNVAPDIYYNLGNAYYKNNQIPQAILNYERTLKLKPDHEDALFNLKMANKKTVDKIERLPELFIANSWRNLVTSKTVNDWSYFTVGLVFLSLVFFIIYLLTNPVLFKKISFYSGSFFLVLSLFCWLMASQHQSINAAASEAIIFESTVTIQSEPNLKAEKLFTLHEGTKVTLLEKVNDWSKIKLPNGNVGWVASSAIEKI